MTGKQVKPAVYSLSLTVQYASTTIGIPSRAQFRSWFKAAQMRDICTTLRIVNADEARQLNRDYRGKDYATNVLTFVYQQQPVLGDVVICASVVQQEAAAQHKDLLAHYAHLAIHAALHLQGYDHEMESDAKIMESIETALMLKLHFKDPYLS